MSEITWRRNPTTAGRSIYSQHVPDHVKEWQAADDRRQRKAVYGEEPCDETDGLTLYRESLHRPTAAMYVERKHNSNVKSLKELRELLEPCNSKTTEDMSREERERTRILQTEKLVANPSEGKNAFSPCYVHNHHFGWISPAIQTRTAHIADPIRQTGRTWARDSAGAIGSMDYCNHVSGKLSMISDRRA